VSAQPDAVAGAVRRALGAGTLYGGVTLLRLTSGVLLLPLLTHALPVRAYAVVALVGPLGWILQSVASLGLNDGLTRSTADLPRGSVVSGAAALRATGVVLAVGGVVAVTGPLWSRLVLGLPWGAAPLWGVVTGTLMSVVAVVSAVLRSEERVVATTVVTLLAAVGAPFVGLAAVLAVDRTGAAYLAGNALALAALVAGTLGWLAGGRPGMLGAGAFRAAGPVVRAGLRTGLPTVPHLVALLCLDAGLRRVVAATHGLDAVAAFAVALVLGSIGWTILKAFSAAWGPVLYRSERSHAADLLRRVTRALLLLSLAVQVAVSFGAPVLAAVFLPASYGGDAALVIVWVAASAVPATVVSVQIVGLFDASRTRSLAVVTPVAVVLGVALAVPLSAAAGPAGAGACYPLTFGLVAVALTVVTHRLGLPSPAGRPVAAAAAVSAAVALAASAAEHAGVAVPVRLAAGILALALAVAVLGRGAVSRRSDAAAVPAEVAP